MLRIRVIPTLLLKDNDLVKTIKFKNPKYIGDPINAVKIFNDKEVDELVFLDVSATPAKRRPNFKLIKEIASEAFMPFGYGGGITKIKEIEELFKLGVEKVILNTSAVKNDFLIKEAANIYGSQSIVVSIDVKKGLFGEYHVMIECGKIKTKIKLIEYIKKVENSGAGEIYINSVDNDGMMMGYDLKLIKLVCENVTIPVIASGGAGNLQHFRDAIKIGGASAVSAGSMFVFQGIHRGILISYIEYKKLEKLLQL